MAQKVPYTIYIDEGQEVEAIRLRPVAAGLSEKGRPSIQEEGSSNATLKATYSGGQPDGEADVTFDI